MSYTYTITKKPRGYSITDGTRTFSWRAECPHVIQPTPDDGSKEWLERAAAAAVEMFDNIPEETPASKRQEAYQEEADPFRNQALSYYVEAAACRLREDLEGAKEAEVKMNAALRQYLEAKETVRSRIPDEE